MKHTKQSIVQLLRTNDRAIARALVVLTERQTADEQRDEGTKYLNGKGFRPCHARMGTSMAKFFQRRGYLTPKQIAYWRMPMKGGKMRIEIYAGQLLEVAQARQATKAADQEDTGYITRAGLFHRLRDEQLQDNERRNASEMNEWLSRIKEKSEFARLELEQEQRAFESKMHRDTVV